MAQVEGIKNAQLQAVAFHMFTKCQEQTQAFEQCYQTSGCSWPDMRKAYTGCTRISCWMSPSAPCSSPLAPCHCLRWLAALTAVTAILSYRWIRTSTRPFLRQSPGISRSVHNFLMCACKCKQRHSVVAHAARTYTLSVIVLHASCVFRLI